MIKKTKTFFIVLRILGTFIAGMVVAVMIALSQVNLETLRSNIVNIIQNSFGVPVNMSGAVSWHFSLRPEIELNDVSIPNQDWAKCRDAFNAKKIVVRLDLVSLLHDIPTIQNIRVYGANVCIEKNKAGNLSVQKIETKTNKETEKSVKRFQEYPFLDPGFGGLEFNELNVKIFEQKYSVSGLQIRHRPRGNLREYSGWIKSDEQVFPFIISYSKYDETRNIYPIKIAMSSDGDALIADLSLSGNENFGLGFSVSGDIPDIAALGRALGIKLFSVPKMNLNISGYLTENEVKFNESNIVTRGTELKLSGNYNWTKGKVKLNLNSSKINLYEFLPELFAGNGNTDLNRPLNAFLDTPLYGDVLYGLNADVVVNIKALTVYRNLRLNDVNMHVVVRDAHGRLDLNTGIANGNIRIGADADIESDGLMHLRAAAIGKKITVGTLLNQINVKNFISELPVDLKFYLEGSGHDLSQVMQTLNGPIQVYSDGNGYAHSELVSNIYGQDFLTNLRHEIQDLFRSEKKYDKIKIYCVVANTKVRNGKIETQNGVAAETAAINVGLSGDLDLGREKIKMALDTVPVRGLKLSLTGNVVNSISINGNMSEPDVQISGAAVAGKVASATGIGLLLAPLTGGIGLVAGAGVGLLAGDLLENWLADDNPCKTAMHRGAPSYRRDIEWINDPIDDLMNTIFNNKQEQKETKKE